MAFLLDTHVLLWNLFKPELLTSSATRILASSSETLHLSSASSLEIAIKSSLGKLSLPSPPDEFVPTVMREMNLIELAVSHTHALKVAALPLHHRDPFDRLLVAQSRSEDLILLTGDSIFAKYDVEAVFCRA